MERRLGGAPCSFPPHLFRRLRHQLSCRLLGKPGHSLPDASVDVSVPAVAAIISRQLNDAACLRKLLLGGLCHFEWAHLIFGRVIDEEEAVAGFGDVDELVKDILDAYKKEGTLSATISILPRF